MIIKVERSGGIAGIQISNQIESKDLPSTFVTKLNKIMENRNADSLPRKSIPTGAADYYSYKISIQDGVNRKVLECNQYNITDDLRSLIGYVERNSKKRNLD